MKKPEPQYAFQVEVENGRQAVDLIDLRRPVDIRSDRCQIFPLQLDESPAEATLLLEAVITFVQEIQENPTRCHMRTLSNLLEAIKERGLTEIPFSFLLSDAFTTGRKTSSLQ